MQWIENDELLFSMYHFLLLLFLLLILLLLLLLSLLSLFLHCFCILSKAPLDSRCKANVELFQIKNIPGPTAHTVGEFPLQRRRSA